MILWLFAIFDLVIGGILAGSLWEVFPWRVTAWGAIALAGKALIFNDYFLSWIDMLAAVYLFLLIFMEGGFFGYVFLGYFAYKVLMSLF